MDDDTLTAMKDRKLKLLSQKNEKRVQELEKRQELKTQRVAEDENINNILAKFETLENDILSSMKKIENGETSQESLPELFDSCYSSLEEWQKMISLTSHFTTIYHKKSFQQKYHVMNEKRLKLEQNLIPQKKFSFKRDLKKTDSDVVPDIKGESSKDVSDDIIEKPQRKYVFKIEDEFGLANKENETVSLTNEDISQKDVVIRNLKNCKLSLEGGASTVHFISLSGCQVLCGPVCTSVFVEKCQNCIFVVACQQLRNHDTSDCDFYLHVTSRPIIEDCRRLRFAPYNWRYENIENHFKAANLSNESNNWNLVHDFNWLSSAPSPNWNLISQEDRVSRWD